MCYTKWVATRIGKKSLKQERTSQKVQELHKSVWNSLPVNIASKNLMFWRSFIPFKTLKHIQSSTLFRPQFVWIPSHLGFLLFKKSQWKYYLNYTNHKMFMFWYWKTFKSIHQISDPRLKYLTDIQEKEYHSPPTFLPWWAVVPASIHLVAPIWSQYCQRIYMI